MKGTEVATQLVMEKLSPPATIEERFRRFHAEHPDVYEELVRLARQAREAGKDRIGMKALFEVIRWNRMVSRDSDDEFKLNNVFTSRYARLIEAQEPDLAGMFETRELRSALRKPRRLQLVERLAS